MKKTLISTAVVAAVFTGASANAASTGPEIYGEVNLSGEYTSDSIDISSGEEGSLKTMKSRNTFIGVKGAKGLDAQGLDIVYDIQMGFDFDSQSSSDDFELRKADIGLAGDMFSVHAGRLENPYAKITKETDLFKNSLASANTVAIGGAFEHLDKTVALYVTPVENLTLGTSYTYDSTEDIFGGIEFDHQSFTAKYDLGQVSVYGGYQRFSFADGFAADEDFIKLGASFSPSENVHLNLVGERYDFDLDEQDSILVQAGYSMDKVLLKGGLGYIGSTDFTNSGNVYAIGADYSIGENTTVGVTYAHVDTDALRNLDGYATFDSSTNEGFAISLSHKF